MSKATEISSGLLSLVLLLSVLSIAPAQAISFEKIGNAGASLGMDSDAVLKVQNNLAKGRLPDSDSEKAPIRVVENRQNFVLETKYIYQDGSVKKTISPDLAAISELAKTSAFRNSGTEYELNAAGKMSGCRVYSSGSTKYYSGCKISGSTPLIAMSYRINFRVDGAGLIQITQYWDQQTTSWTGSVSPIGFSTYSTNQVAYKVSWNGYGGFSSHTYTLSTSIKRWGVAYVQIY